MNIKRKFYFLNQKFKETNLISNRISDPSNKF